MGFGVASLVRVLGVVPVLRLLLWTPDDNLDILIQASWKSNADHTNG